MLRQRQSMDAAGRLLAYGTGKGAGLYVTLACMAVLLIGVIISIVKIVQSGSRNGEDE